MPVPAVITATVPVVPVTRMCAAGRRSLTPAPMTHGR